MITLERSSLSCVVQVMQAARQNPLTIVSVFRFKRGYFYSIPKCTTFPWTVWLPFSSEYGFMNASVANMSKLYNLLVGLFWHQCLPLLAQPRAVGLAAAEEILESDPLLSWDGCHGCHRLTILLLLIWLMHLHWHRSCCLRKLLLVLATWLWSWPLLTHLHLMQLLLLLYPHFTLSSLNIALDSISMVLKGLLQDLLLSLHHASPGLTQESPL